MPAFGQRQKLYSTSLRSDLSSNDPLAIRCYFTVDDGRLGVQEQRAVPHGEVDMAGRVALAAAMGVRAGGEQEIAVERPAVLAFDIGLVVHAQDVPVAVVAQAPAEMRN